MAKIKTDKSDVDKWIDKRIPHQVKAIEKASKVFDDKDNLSVNTLEAIYGKESSFGDNNIGQGRVAQAQALAKAAGKNPENWNDVQEFLIAAGATKKQMQEVIEYVKKVLEYKKEFEKKSEANKNLKNKDLKEGKLEKDGHWVTIDDHPVLIKNKKNT